MPDIAPRNAPALPWLGCRLPGQDLSQISFINHQVAVSDLDCAMCPARLEEAGIRSILSLDIPGQLEAEYIRNRHGWDIVDYIAGKDGQPHPKLIEAGIEKVILFRMSDSENNSEVAFRSALSHLAELAEIHPPVLVHCSMGGSRAPSVAAAYLAKVEGRTFRQVVNRIQQIRPTALSPGFVNGIVAANGLLLE